MATNWRNQAVQHLRRAALRQGGAGLTDGELLGCFIEHRDEAAFAALVERHGPMVWGVCRRLLGHHDAEDAFQATFLVLVRKAASVVPKEMVANWLYGVAHRTALHARRTAARRGAREKPVADLPDHGAVPQDLWHDLQPLLDQELSRLPDKYRAVIVLCELEGRSRKEVARQLGVPEGTVAGRLARARALLAKRLGRHGLAVVGGALAATLAHHAASAGVPPSAVSATVKVASLVTAGQTAAAGVVSARVAALTEGVVKAMLLDKLKIALAVVLVVAALGGATGLIYRTQAGGREDRPAAEPAEKPRSGEGVLEKEAREIVMAYLDNDAQGDEAYLGQRLRVTGRVLRVERVTRGAVPYYLLTLYADPSEPGNPPVVLAQPEKTPLAFVFPVDSRKELARLEGGQRVTVEGVCEGRSAAGRDAVTFTGCELAKAR